MLREAFARIMTDPKNSSPEASVNRSWAGSWAGALVNLGRGFNLKNSHSRRNSSRCWPLVQVDRTPSKHLSVGVLRHRGLPAPLRGSRTIHKALLARGIIRPSPRIRSSIRRRRDARAGDLRPRGAQARAELSDPRRFAMLRFTERRSPRRAPLMGHPPPPPPRDRSGP